ncbi:P-loop containing nucleoside triphosphate hydrolase protein [Macrolepiota fuliginosa MF-IS2]|uniref:RNA helicase n=1 Tax=Macrolepiota fuliginosa MF-IS2 TaxID=1400762 RepID=A0A9P5XMN7_9AGAR|nr:P-loop containing nucleoside triphosphate hydrolase protein [Macrolepiota fuliginosa MF-IS2]
MPPKRGIVKSGNAGNSSKPQKSAEPGRTKPEGEKPLFPSGFKYPLSLLHERCQKEGWEKPTVDTIHHGEKGYSFVVTLAKINKKSSERETVRLSPHQPYYRPSVVEARHWGATYALYRFCNGMQLHRTLPPGPRDYWNELAAEQKTALEHQSWVYAADPFIAWQQVKDRQAKAAQKRETDKNTPEHKTGAVPGSYDHSPEVKMATPLREEVEEAIKEGFALYGSENTLSLDEQVVSQVTSQLITLGFKDPQVKKAASFLSQASPLLGQFLGSSSPLEAATEYLLLHTPECDLPSRFLPNTNSSNSFISSVHSGTSDMKKRWIEDKATKEAGWPTYIIQEYTTDPTIFGDWPLLLVKLGKRLLGIQADGDGPPDLPPFHLNEDELQSLGAELLEDGHYALPSFTAPMTLHVFFNASHKYPRPYYAPMFITSNQLPPYIRLHVLSCILSMLYCASGTEAAEESFGISLMRIMDEEWARVEDEGPPDVSTVMAHMLPVRKTTATILTPPKVIEKKVQTANQTSHANIPERITETRKRLPAFQARKDFLNILSNNQVVIVVGETGSGKTTQLPQYILESFEDPSEQGHEPSIIITQPRRISAISVANRVSDERGNDGTVGYAVRGKSKQGRSTRLLFCTTGVVLRRLNNGDRLQNVSHVIVDEVHERSLDGDFLLLSLKQLLWSHRKLKVVLMSATINHEVFARYFNGAPVLSIPGITHPVTDRYLEDIIPTIGYIPSSINYQEKTEDKQMQKWETLQQLYRNDLNHQTLTAVHHVAGSKTIDYHLLSSLVAYIIEKHERAGILLFLPGVNEIRQCVDAINSRLGTGVANVLPLHANLPIEEQNQAFNKTTKWKIIVATNVAETSITIDDIVYVIDSGKVKETRYTPETDLTRLEETLITRAAARQRRGRAGRMQPGVCYKLYTKHTESVTMEEFPKPEILRVPLEQISLSAKMMNEDGDIREILGEVIDPPDSATVDHAWQSLQELSAIDAQDKLTPLGRHIAMLPLDVHLSKMLVLGTIFHCLSPILSITALLSSKSLFLVPEAKRDEASRARARFSTENRDILTNLEAFNQCQKLKGKNLQLFCKENFISTTTLQEIFTLRREFCTALEERGFVPPQCDPMDSTMNANSKNLNLLKAIMLGGLWPRVARVHLPPSAIKFDKIQAGTIQRDNTAKEFKMFDLKQGRVFIHPGSVLFDCASWKSPFLVYFHRYQSSKVFLRDATEAPIYALLLFGGPVSVDYVRGGLTIGDKDAFVKLKAWPRIGVLVNQLRQLLDILLSNCIEDGTSLSETQNHPVIRAMLSLLARDGMTE